MACPGFIKTKVSINALTANGDAQGTMDDAQEHGMSAEASAEKLYKAISDRKEEIYSGRKSNLIRF